MPKADVLAIVWSPHEARTAAFAQWLDAELHNVHYLREKRPWLAPAKYLLQWWATWWLLARRRPHTVYVTNSPPVAGLCVMTFCWFTPTRFVLDTHPPGLYNRLWGWSRPVQRFTSRFATMNVIDQERFAAWFREWGSPVLVLENPPKRDLPPRRTAPDPDRPRITYVGTFADDEPIEALLEAARTLPDVHFDVLGDTGRAQQRWLEDAPENVTFTGYVLKEAYWSRIYGAHAVVVLTTHAYSLLGGAQDALTAGTPLVVSDQPTLRDYFTSGTVFAENTGTALAAALRLAIDDHDRLSVEMAELRARTASRWERDFATLRRLIHGPRQE